MFVSSNVLVMASFVTTKICFVTTNMCLSGQTRVCHDKTFVLPMTDMGAAPVLALEDHRHFACKTEV